MADVNVQRRPEETGRSLQRNQGGLFGRRFPSLWRRPDEEFLTNPFTMMRRFSEEMDRMFSSAWDDREFGSRELGSWAPPVEVRERDGNLVVHAELPGLNKDDVKVEVTNEGLVIQGERSASRKRTEVESTAPSAVTEHFIV